MTGAGMTHALHHQIAIIGSGFAGLGMAAGLRRRGVTDFVVLERAGEVGGTWRDNTYPGCACDVKSDLYSFSFAPNPEWGHRYARQPEILAYLRRVADDFVRPNGLAFSPDERLLYIADTGASHVPDGPRHIRVFEVEGGRLRCCGVFATRLTRPAGSMRYTWQPSSSPSARWPS